jgi:toxin ParE1/3/4
MGKPYRLSPLAEADLEEIWFYTLKHWSLEQADIYHHSLVAAFAGLAAGTK